MGRLLGQDQSRGGRDNVTWQCRMARFPDTENAKESTTGRQTMKKVSANAPSSSISSADTPEQRSKNIAEKLRQQQGERDGVVLGCSRFSRMPRRPGEANVINRIINRYLELLKQRGDKPRGIPVLLANEFDMSPQLYKERGDHPLFIHRQPTNADRRFRFKRNRLRFRIKCQSPCTFAKINKRNLNATERPRFYSSSNR